MSSANPPPPLSSTPSEPPTQAQILSQIDLAISYTLHLWPALSLAVSSQWGGPSSSDKRDWFAGAISDLFLTRPSTDQSDLEELMEQVMGDEFECVVDDGSLEVAAREIVRLRGECLSGEFGGVERVRGLWESQKGKVTGRFERGAEVDQDTDGEEEDDGEEGGEDEDEDEVMGEAPELVKASKPKVEPEVDEEGFTKVVGRRKR
jgi:pre-rRNA-processing protein TSR2